MKTSKFTKLYCFDFDKGVPVEGATTDTVTHYKWRHGVKTIGAYDLQNAVEKFALPAIKQYGTSIKLNITACHVSSDGKQWSEIDLQSVYFSAYLVGCFEREKTLAPACR